MRNSRKTKTIEERELKVAIKNGGFIAVAEFREAWTRHVARARALMETRLLNELPPVKRLIDWTGACPQAGGEDRPEALRGTP